MILVAILLVDNNKLDAAVLVAVSCGWHKDPCSGGWGGAVVWDNAISCVVSALHSKLYLGEGGCFSIFEIFCLIFPCVSLCAA